jgi:RNA polymerase sigma-70 factor (ECF subfamily)
MSGTLENPATEQELLAAARAGDESAFGALVEPRRGELHAHCYRMLGSVHDAEDALQEVMLRAWRALPRFEGRSSFRSWLYTIATNTSLNAIEKRPKRVLPIDYGPAADPHNEVPSGPSADAPRIRETIAPYADLDSVWVEPYPDAALGLGGGLAAPEARFEQRESVELAFVAALQHLPANQRAVLILREVLGFSAKEVAETLETSTASVNSALQRARKVVDERLPEQSQQATLRTLGDERLGEIVECYMNALERGDVDAIVEMLSEDASWSMPPMPLWYQGHDSIRRFFAAGPLQVRWRHRATRANGQLAVGCYAWDEEQGTFRGHIIDVLTLRDDGRIAAVTAFIDAELFERFGLPAELPG